MSPSQPAPSGSPTPAAGPSSRGFAAALGAYLAWGLFPLYFRAIRAASPLEILAHRVLGSALLLAALVTLMRRWADVRGSFRGRQLRAYLTTTALIAANWLLYIWAVNSGHVLESSLGYFINPLVNVALGVVFLRESLSPRQAAAVAVAVVGVLVLVVGLGSLPWISLTLAVSFGLYGFVRKRAGLDVIVGLFVETSILAPFALAFLIALSLRGSAAFGSGAAMTALLALAGPLTALPLLGFAKGVRSLRYSTMGLLQYLSPTGQFFLAIGLYHERFTRTHAVAFACIWASLALYTWDALARVSRTSAPRAPVEGAAGALPERPRAMSQNQ